MKPLKSAMVSLALMAALLFPATAFSVVHQISMQNFFFSPPNSAINVGDTVRWTNATLTIHTSTSDTRIWSSGPLSQGQSYSHVFLTPGVFPYQCSVHVAFGMRDTIHVGTTAVGDPQPSIPNGFQLSQNYPNPFNAETVIEYSIPADGDVTLTVFDITGREVQKLVEGNQAAGVHQVTWDATRYGSGIYFYKINSGDFSQTRRATLLK